MLLEELALRFFTAAPTQETPSDEGSGLDCTWTAGRKLQVDPASQVFPAAYDSDKEQTKEECMDAVMAKWVEN